MLQMRPGCACWDIDLLPEVGNARLAGRTICSFECTFCTACVASKRARRCPNCGGGFSPRPTRVGGALERNPASRRREHNPGGCAGRA